MTCKERERERRREGGREGGRGGGGGGEQERKAGRKGGERTGSMGERRQTIVDSVHSLWNGLVLPLKLCTVVDDELPE